MLDAQTPTKASDGLALGVTAKRWVGDAPMVGKLQAGSPPGERHWERLADRSPATRRRLSASGAALDCGGDIDPDAKTTANGGGTQPSGNVGAAVLRDPAAEAMDLLPASHELRTKADASGRGRPVVADQPSCTAVALLRDWFDRMKPGTGTSYIKRARQHLRRLGLEDTDPLILDGPTALALARSLHDRDIDRSSERQYRAAIATAIAGSLLAADAAADAAARADLLVAYLVADATKIEPTSGQADIRDDLGGSNGPDGSVASGGGVDRGADGDAGGRPPPRAGRRHRKALPDKDLVVLLEALKRSKSRRAGTLGLLLVALQRTGVRPCEVRQMKQHRRPGGGILLRVVNAKYDQSGHRTHGPVRTLLWDKLPFDVVRAIEASIMYAANFNEEQWRREREAMQRLLRTTYARVFPRRTTTITLYSGRHQFAADAKHAYADDPDGASIVAALMGHATDLTASQHYARASAGRRGAVAPAANPSEVAKVRTLKQASLNAIPSLPSHAMGPRLQ